MRGCNEVRGPFGHRVQAHHVRYLPSPPPSGQVARAANSTSTYPVTDVEYYGIPEVYLLE